MIKVNKSMIAVAEEPLSLFVNAALPIDVAFAMKKIIKAYNPELVRFKKDRLAIYEKYGEFDANGNINIKPENKEEFEKEFTALLNEVVELDVNIVKTQISWLPTNLRMTPEQLSGLEPFVELEA